MRTIYSYGIDITAGFIVGFNSDDKTIFDRQYEFIVSSGIAMAMVGLLYAAPKTPLHERLRLKLFKDRPHVWIDLKQSLDEKLSNALARIIHKTLKQNREAVVIDCRQLAESSSARLALLLRQLQRYREQIHICVTQPLY